MLRTLSQANGTPSASDVDRPYHATADPCLWPALDDMPFHVFLITFTSIVSSLSVPIAFAMLKTSHAEPGTAVLVSAEGEHTEATVVPLRFHPQVAP